jgi:hypothetical protein
MPGCSEICEQRQGILIEADSHIEGFMYPNSFWPVGMVTGKVDEDKRRKWMIKKGNFRVGLPTAIRVVAGNLQVFHPVFDWNMTRIAALKSPPHSARALPSPATTQPQDPQIIVPLSNPI